MIDPGFLFELYRNHPQILKETAKNALQNFQYIQSDLAFVPTLNLIADNGR